MDANGLNQRRLTYNHASNGEPAYSPDGRQLIFISYRDGNFQVMIVEADGNRIRQLTRDPLDHFFPVWSPDGRYIVFAEKLMLGSKTHCGGTRWRVHLVEPAMVTFSSASRHTSAPIVYPAVSGQTAPANSVLAENLSYRLIEPVLNSTAFRIVGQRNIQNLSFRE
jgi:dipeptidyl aminopeptidase/acylaminoacyl peptidase